MFEYLPPTGDVLSPITATVFRFSLFCCLFLISSTYHGARAQTVLRGQVLTAERQPVPGALVEVQLLRGDESVGVGMTDEAGHFAINTPAKPDSLRLSVRALGFAEITRTVANRPQPLLLTLAASTTKLTEVTVKAPPMRREGDTLSYHVASFAGRQDRVIADVLKKLPGIEVEADGRILYEGKPIQKFYINGADLLENRYNQASNNLPADAVLDVQVLKRHQPIAALRGVQASEQASLNISLKKKVSLTGQARLGGGVPPARWDLNLAPMLFTPRQQLLDTYQASNTGRELAADVLRLGDATLTEPGQQQPTLVGIQALSPPPLASGRYLFSRAQLLTANHLLTLPHQAQLRLNVAYLRDEQTQTGSTRTRYSVPDGSAVVVDERKRNTLAVQHLTTDLGYERNAAAYYLKNTVSLAGSWDAQTGTVQLAGSTQPVQQYATFPAFMLSNRLGLVRPLGPRYLGQLSSVLTLATSAQQLTVSPGPLAASLGGGQPYEQASQQAQAGTLYMANALTVRTTAKGRWHWAYAVGCTQELTRLRSDLTRPPEPGPAADTLRNHLSARQARYYTEARANYKSPRWYLELALPFSFRTFGAADALLAARQRRQLLAPELQAAARYELSALWHATASVGRTNEFGSAQQLQYGYLLHDYRTLVRNAAPLVRTRTWDVQAGLYYENPLTTWFYRLTYGYTRFERNQLSRTLVRPDGTLTTVALDYANHSQLQLATASASHFVDTWKATVEAQLSGNRQQQPLVLNNALTTATSQSATAQCKATANTFAWGGLSYSAALTALRNQVGTSSFGAGTWLHQQHASASWYLAERHLLLLDADYYRNQALGPAVHNTFLDATYRYTLPAARKTDIEFIVSNLFDTNVYQSSYVSSFVLVQNDYRLRPRQCLLTLRTTW